MARATPPPAPHPRNAAMHASTSTKPAKLKHALGSFHIPVGNIHCHLIADGTAPYPLAQAFAANADPDEAANLLKDHFLPTHGHGPLAVNALLINAPNATILIDAGCGNDSPQGVGLLQTHLDQLNIKPNHIDAALITHLHSDHTGGFLSPEPIQSLHNTPILITHDEHDFWSNNPDIPNPTTPAQTKQRLIDTAQQTIDSLKPRLEPVPANHRLADGVTLVPMPGHTPGHVGVQIESEGQLLLFITDLIHVPALQLQRTDWYAAFDTDPKLAIETKRRLLERIAADRLTIAGTHLPFPATVHLHKTGNHAYAFQPAFWTF